MASGKKKTFDIRSKGTSLLIVVIVIAILALAVIHFEVGDVVKASFEDETNDEVWTDLDVDYRPSMDAAMAVVTVTFHNNKIFETSEKFDDEYYNRTFNFTSFDFRLRSTEDTAAYTAGIQHLSKENVELPFGESYEMTFRVYDLVEGEPINVELSAYGYENADRRTTLTETLPFTLETPIYSLPEESPGFTFVFVIFSILFATYIIKKD